MRANRERYTGVQVEYVEIVFSHLVNDPTNSLDKTPIRITNNANYSGYLEDPADSLKHYYFNACGLNGVSSSQNGTGMPMLTVDNVRNLEGDKGSMFNEYGTNKLNLMEVTQALVGAVVNHRVYLIDFDFDADEILNSLLIENNKFIINQTASYNSSVATFQLITEFNNPNNKFPSQTATRTTFPGLGIN